jgi:hypothetical protein
MVFKIFAVLCLMNVGDLNQNLCFKTQVPLDFKNKIDCQLALDNFINYLDGDLKKRQTSLAMICKQDSQTINI